MSLLEPLSARSSASHEGELGDASAPVAEGHAPRVVVTGGFSDTLDALLLSVARGDRDAFVALQHLMVDLVRVNVRRVLRDASRSEAVTQETFAEVLEDAPHFDPHRDSAETWLLTRAHQHALEGLHSVDEREVDTTAQDQRSLPGHRS